MFSKEKAFEAMKICFLETKQKYLSYGDFHFLLHKNGRIGQTAPREKKKRYQDWEKQFKDPLVGWKYPYRKFIFESSRIKEITEALIKEGKLKKNIVKKRPCYYLTEKIERPDIFRINHQNIINNVSFEDMEVMIRKGKRKGGQLSNITFYGVPKLYPRIKPEAISMTKELGKLANKLEKIASDFMAIMQKYTTLKLNEIIDEIGKGSFIKKDKKLAFLYLNQLYAIESRKALNYIYNIKHNDGESAPSKNESNREKENNIEKMDFQWTGDGKTLEYLPQNYTLSSDVSDLLYSYLKYEKFWRSKMIVIDSDNPEIKQIYKSGEELVLIKNRIQQYLNKH